MKSVTRFVLSLAAVAVIASATSAPMPVAKDFPAPPICWPTCTRDN